VALLKGLVASTWLATGPATRVRTRAMDGVIASRAGALSRQERLASWNAQVTLSAECVTELQWWADNLPHIGSCPIGDVPLGHPFGSTVKSDAGDAGVGAVTCTDGTGTASSTLVAARLALAPAAVASRRMVVRHARLGIEFMAALPQQLLSGRSTLRELYGIATAIAPLAHLLLGG
jgi:hypothetical protein